MTTPASSTSAPPRTTSRNLTHSFTVDQSPEAVFAAINNVRAWWSGEIEGNTDRLGDEWTYRYQDIHCSRQRIIELVPGKRVVWLVLDSTLNFVADKTEWNGTQIIFEIARQGNQTEVVFTHVGLTPAEQCFNGCNNAWGSYINGSLRNLIATGKGQPNPIESPRATAVA